MKLFATVLAIFMVAAVGFNAVDASSGFSFGYDGESGPDHWAEYYETCGGQYQSPINIEEHKVQQVQLSPLHFRGFDEVPVTSKLTNNGHTAMLEMTTTGEVLVSGGPLKEEYVFAQLHFHWGESDSAGSEDTINNRSYPMEMHMVTYKKAYGNVADAGKHQDGLAVMAFFYEVIDTDNAAYANIVDTLPLIHEPDTNASLTDQVSLNMLASENRVHYYTYHGSLTTPPCSEVVTWIEFMDPVLVSEDQLEAFRSLEGHEGPMSHNYRPTQPIGGRIVWYNEANIEVDTDDDQKTKTRAGVGAGAGAGAGGTVQTVNSFVITILLSLGYVTKELYF